MNPGEKTTLPSQSPQAAKQTPPAASPKAASTMTPPSPTFNTQSEDTKKDDVSTTEKLKQVKDQVMQKTEEIEHQAEAVKARAEEMNDKFLALIKERPAVSVGVAFVSGYLVGKLALRRWLA